MADYRVLSGDSHIVEPPDLWEKRLDPAFRERAPHVIRKKGDPKSVTPYDSDYWVAPGIESAAYGQLAQAGRRFENPDEIGWGGTWDDVPKGAYDPHAMIQALEQDDVWGGIVQPTQGLSWYRMDPSETDLLSAICRSWNDYIAEFCSYYPDRLKGIAMLNVDDVVDACTELERCAKMGLAGAFIPEHPLAERPYNHPIYERLWWTAQYFEIPLLLHVFTTRPNIPGCESFADESKMTMVSIVTMDHWVQYSLCAMIFAGIFDRYPNLNVGSVEHELAWVPHILHRMDFNYKERPEIPPFYRSSRGLLPSETWRSNIFVEFMEDDIGIGLRDLLGVDSMIWGNDYPHAESTWPKSMEWLDKVFAGVPEEDRRKITSDNAAKLFHFW